MSTGVKLTKDVSNVSNIQIKSVDILLQKRAQLAKNVNSIGLADTAIYHFTKETGFFGKKQQRIVFTFFQGLNTNPQNLSIFLRDMVTRLNKQSKQKLTKGQFVVYDIFNEHDCVIQISIPGNFQIYKIKNLKKQLISNSEIDNMFVSSTLRSMYERNMVWGKCYNIFGTKNVLQEFKAFLHVFFRVIQKKDFVISQDYEHKSTIKGSHSCSILLNFIKSKCLVRHSIQFVQKQINARGGYNEAFPKISILLAELYSSDGKYAKSLSIIGTLLNKFQNDPYLLYYQSKYMFQLVAVHEALLIVNSIVQYNQFQIWCLAAQLHIELKNYNEALVCLNHASRIAGKSAKMGSKFVQIELVYAELQKIGKKNILTTQDQITQRPRLMMVSQSPVSIANSIQQKYRSIVQSEYWRMGAGQKIIYNMLKTLRYRLETKKFQQLIENTFQESKKQYPIINFKSGMSQSMFVDIKQQQNEKREEKLISAKQQQQELPNFLKDQSVQIQAQQVIRGNRNLSIIPELESVIQNSNFQQKQKQSHKLTPVKHKKQLNEHFFKIIKAVLSQGQVQKAQFQQNWAKILPVYNKLRSSAKLNSFYVQKLFEVMMKIQNYKSVIVLIAQCLDFYEQLGVKKIEVLPFWMQKYIFSIIQQKGLKALNLLLEKMQFLDEALIDTIQLAKSWKIKGCTF